MNRIRHTEGARRNLIGRWRAVGRHSFLSGSLVAMLSLTGCAVQGSFFNPAGPIAEAQRDHFFSVLAWMAVVVLPVAIGLPLVLWRYRSGKGRGAYDPDWSYNTPLEIAIWLLPAIVVVALGLNLWRETMTLDPYKQVPAATDAAPLTIQVVAMDWKFLFLYPESGIATVNEIVVPVGRPLRFRLTSQTVMQSFVIPRLGGQMYAMAGMTTELNLLADQAGAFRGQNAQYNGEGFANQKFAVRAIETKAFKSWVDEVRSNGDLLDGQAFNTLSQPSIIGAHLEYRSYPTGLFENVLSRARNASAHTGSKDQRHTAPDGGAS